MKIKRSVLLCGMGMWICVSAFSQINEGQLLHVIPKPVSATVEKGHFFLKPNTRIVISGTRSSAVASMLAKMLYTPTGYRIGIKQGKAGRKRNAIILHINAEKNDILSDEGYTLKVFPHSVRVAANKPQGLFYGIQTLMQLFPPQIESDTTIKDKIWTVPCVNILDYPKFKWRGLMLDVSRHFFTKKEVEEYIDAMAKYKFNVFHWHLTDDQGWRIQIKGLPELTEVGAWRVPRIGKWGTFKEPEPGEKATDGGYYTQKDIREVVEYARKRFVAIVPEIDVPAHSLALIASYPNLSCTKVQYAVNPGSKLLRKKIDNVVCVGNDSTWLILDRIFTQIAELFPGQYIHIGGDEAYKGFWEDCPKDKALMKREGISSLEGLQGYFEERLHELILSKGKKAIGWDEILEGGLPRGITVMSWRGMSGGIKASQMGHHVIMTPYGSTYISQLQGNPLVEPDGPGMTRLKECYFTDILPAGVDTGMVLGGEGCLWTEHVPNFRHAEYMTWPRALALAEVFWGTKSNWEDFTRRVIEQFKYLDAAQIKYARSLYDPMILPLKEKNGAFKIKLTTEISGLNIYYRFDGTNPDRFSPRYEGKPLDIPQGASEIKMITYQNGKPVGHQINCPLSYLKKKLEKHR